MCISEEMLVCVRIVCSQKSKFNSVVWLFAVYCFLVLFVAVLWFVFSCAVAHKCVFLGPLPMFLEHQHPLVVGVGRSSRKKKSNMFTFGLGFLYLLLRQTLATPEPCLEKQREISVFRLMRLKQRYLKDFFLVLTTYRGNISITTACVNTVSALITHY